MGERGGKTCYETFEHLGDEGGFGRLGELDDRLNWPHGYRRPIASHACRAVLSGRYCTSTDQPCHE